ncbi:DUF3265 domain-containing protein [Vibrio vulnificus]|nr:DUF3265 domain-containing protein [Vibrio vulnificus]EIZ1460320.1 DUF3265 domain-containing protein [Vibrio vulnificus]EJE8572327.1 DUF3265 domain-containing protein [Vibrio vulnificus]ELP6736714.1 DUF3265 domain-containing protein [Vibrio vulnificus]ELX4166773.1 DUF3265 domain-containing protein [Vibrio vulnificus]
MTKRLSGIWHAWHFQFALGSVIKSLCGSFCSACLHPLTRRYMPVIRKSIAEMISSLKVLRSFTGSFRILVGTLAI